MAKIQVPRECVEAGLECGSCVRNTAGQLARVSRGLPSEMLTLLFVQLYPNQECAPMHRRFANAYRAACADQAKVRAAAA